MNYSIDKYINPEYNPFKLIKIVKNYSTEDMAMLFNCTSAYIKMIENGERVLSEKTLQEKLGLLGISMEDYVELCRFLLRLQKSGLEEYRAYPLALVKALGIVYSDERKQCDGLAKIPRFRSRVKSNPETLERKYITIHTVYR